jgi:hypothetical protein
VVVRSAGLFPNLNCLACDVFTIACEISAENSSPSPKIPVVFSAGQKYDMKKLSFEYIQKNMNMIRPWGFHLNMNTTKYQYEYDTNII